MLEIVQFNQYEGRVTPLGPGTKISTSWRRLGCGAGIWRPKMICFDVFLIDATAESDRVGAIEMRRE
jgi:hypothetical protein